MLKIAGFGLLGLAALMVIPSGVSADAAPVMYGAANIELRGADGDVKMSQAVHNRITDEGERFLIDQVFDTGDSATSTFRVNSICIVSDSYTAYSESTTAQDQNDNKPSTNAGSIDSADPADRLAERSLCVGVGSVDDSGGSTAMITNVDFVADQHVGSNQAIGGFVVCNDSGSVDCNAFGTGIAFAAVDINDISLQQAGDSLDITYTFDITTPDY